MPCLLLQRKRIVAMELISAIALNLALGAGAIAGKEVVSGLIKDAYAALKAMVRERYPQVSVGQLEQAPASKSRRAVVEEDLANAGAGQDAALLAAARQLGDAIQQAAPGLAAAIGVDLKEVEAANLRLRDIAAAGTGVRGEKLKISGDIDIQGVRAGMPPRDPTGG
jgi:hypothetical protein